MWLGDEDGELVILSILICKDLSDDLELRDRLEVTTLGVLRKNMGS